MNLFFSFLLVALGGPTRISWLGQLASVLGLALFWRQILPFPQKKRFLYSLVWFAFVQFFQLSWMGSIRYLGFSFLFIYLLLCLFLGAQFGVLSWILPKNKPLKVLDIAALASFWVFGEWLRLFWMSGFPWNPIGYLLSGSLFSLQMASIVGVYGLSFWVIWVNGLSLRLFLERKGWALWGISCLFPYLYGMVSLKEPTAERVLDVALVDTGHLVEEKYWTPPFENSYIAPLDRWIVLWKQLKEMDPVDLVVFPEGLFTVSADRPSYLTREVEVIWEALFNQKLDPQYKKRSFLTSAILAQMSADQFHQHLLLGLEESIQGKHYNAAMLFSPGENKRQSQRKQILIPVGEYVPKPLGIDLSSFFAKNFGVIGSFEPSKEKTLLEGPCSIGALLCLEELYGHLSKGFQEKGAELLVGISNDVWFPGSKLGQEHFFHARLRAVESGLPLIRSANLGVLGVIDPFGRVISSYQAQKGGVLKTQVALTSRQTLYRSFQEIPLFFLSAFLVIVWGGKTLLRNKSVC